MTETTRRELIAGTAAAAALAATPALAAAAVDTPAQARVREVLRATLPEHIERLRRWIALPSIAAEGRNSAEGARYMADLALQAGFSRPEIVPSRGKPGVFATMDNGSKRTVGLYFMYDVKQFVAEEWSSPPLEGRIVDKPGFGRCVVGRGAVNQKGPETAMLAGLHAMRAAGAKPPVNFVLVCEGEEEIGSPNFRDIVTAPQVLAAMRRCEGVYIPSADQDERGNVTLELGAKGVVELELVSQGGTGSKWGRGAPKDIHSSLAAMVDSPAWRLVGALGTLTDKGGTHILVPGWYDRVRGLTPRERELVAIQARAQSEGEMKRAYGVGRWIDDLGWNAALERLVSQPTLNIEGLVGGYTGPGGKTVLPGRAAAKIDLRLVPEMTREDCVAKLRAHLDRAGYPDIAVEVTGGYDPTATDERSRHIAAQLATYKRLGVTTALNPRSAGSWPGVVFTGEPLKLPANGFGLGYGTGAHAPDEFYVVESSNPRVEGMVGAAMSHVHLWEALARG